MAQEIKSLNKLFAGGPNDVKKITTNNGANPSGQVKIKAPVKDRSLAVIPLAEQGSGKKINLFV